VSRHPVVQIDTEHPSAYGLPATRWSGRLKRRLEAASGRPVEVVPYLDARVPDIIGIAQHGVVYTGGKKKIAEHGGDDPQDRDVPILVSLPGAHPGRVIDAPVETTQIAPTILALLGLNPRALQAVRIEHTRLLPGLARH